MKVTVTLEEGDRKRKAIKTSCRSMSKSKSLGRMRSSFMGGKLATKVRPVATVHSPRHGVVASRVRVKKNGGENCKPGER